MTMTQMVHAFEKDPKRGFVNMAEFFWAAHLAEMTGNVDPRLEVCRTSPMASLGSDEQRTSSNPLGGFLAPAALATESLRVAPEADPMPVTLLPMSASVYSIPARTDKDHSTSATGGLKLVRLAETEEYVPQRVKSELITFEPGPFGGVSFVTDALLADGGVAVMNFYVNNFADARVDILRNEWIRGSGAGESLGVLNAPCLITIDLDVSQDVLVTGNNVTKMAERCWGYDSPLVRWVANPELRSVLSSLLLSPGGARAYKFAKSDDEHDRLLGRPVFYDERCSAPGQVGDLILGNWPEYLSAVWRPFTGASSTFVRFVASETAFRFYEVGEGRPWWRSVLTPQRGTKTMSPFVTLAGGRS